MNTNAYNQSDKLMSRTAEIKLTIDLDGDKLPTRIVWQASDAENPGPTICQSAMISLWDRETKTTASIDLWTPEMTVDDMNIHVYQVIHKLADTYWRATKDKEVADVIHQFGDGFGKTLGLANAIDSESD
jgi:gliding motility-associated protein GldC